MEKTIWKIPSSDGVHLLHTCLYLPQGECKGIFQVIHGMTDYTDRYEALLTAMANEGYVAFGFDLLGHGHTAQDYSELGYFAEQNGWRHLVSDVQLVAGAVKDAFGNALPYILLGHSMGSFIARCVALEEGAPDGLILVGTGGPQPTGALGIFMCDVLSKLYGKRHISYFMQGMVFGDYDRKFPEEYKNRWITVDTANLIKYKDDPFCTFRFSVSAISDLIHLHQRANSAQFFSDVSSEIPILLLSGEDDPVGDFGKGVKKVYQKLLKKQKNVTMHLYPGFRHEILQDFCRDEVIEEIKAFVK